MEQLTTVHQGEMKKRGGGTFSRGFRKRTFQLQCGATEKRLVYFKGDPKKVDPKGMIDLNTAQSIQLDKEKRRILIVTPKRTWVLRAKTVAECQTWIQWMTKDPRAAQLNTIRKSTVYGQGLLDLAEFAEYEASRTIESMESSCTESSFGETYTEEIKDEDRDPNPLHSTRQLTMNLEELDKLSGQLRQELQLESDIYSATSPSEVDY